MVNEIAETRKPKTEKPKPEKTEAKVVKSTKPAKEKKSRVVKPAKFPIDAKINDYSFLHFRVSVLKALGWSKGMPLKIELNADGSITLRKL